MLDYNNKKVLLIAPSFYNYNNIIINKLKQIFNNVYYINETINNYNLFYKVINNLFNSQMQKTMDRYFISSIKEVPRDIDYVFCIRCYYLSGSTIEYMRKYFKANCKFVNYQWDNSDVVPIIKDTHRLYDKVFTFDINDSNKYSWKYRPLFFVEEMVTSNLNRNIDVFSLGSFNIERYNLYQIFKDFFDEYNLNSSLILYDRRLRFLFDKFFKKRSMLKNIKLNKLVFNSLSINELYDAYSNSKCVLDYTIKMQTGFTMRTIECIGNKCKIITNNKNIYNADFYNSNNIYVYDESNPKIDKDFILSPYTDLPEELYKKYTLDSFIKDIFCEAA